MSNSRTTRAIEPQVQVSGKNSARGGVSLGKKALSVLMSVVLVMGLNPGFAVANTGGGSTTAGNIAAQAVGAYTITFNSNGGTSVPSTTSDPDGKVTEPNPAPTKDGYTLDGWYKESSLTTKWNFSSDTAESAMTLYAKWAAASNIQVTFKGNGSDTDYSENVNQTYQAAYTLPTTNPEKTGYNFNGWWTAKEGGTQVTTSTIVNVTKAQVLYAHWTPKVITITLNGNYTNATSTTKNVTYDSTFGDLPTPTRANYTFKGWYTHSTSTTAGAVKVTSDTKYDADLTSSSVVWETANTLYAAWDKADYEITLNLNGGKYYTDTTHTTLEPQVKTVAFEDSLTLPNTGTTTGAISRPGYTLVGWYVNVKETRGETQYAGGTTISSVDANTPSTLYARWTPSVNTISFQAATANWGTSAGKTPTSKDVTNPEAVKVTSGGIYADAFRGSALTDETRTGLPTPEAEGYTFEGWYTLDGYAAAKNWGKQIAGGDLVEGDIPATLYAKWTPKTYTVTFDTKGGTGDVEDIEVTVGKKYPTLPVNDDLEKPGYSLAGWYTSEDFTGSPVTASSVVDTVSTTLYAKWEPAVYNVTYEPNGGNKITASDKLTYTMTGDALVLPTAAEISRPVLGSSEKYTFVGWHEKADLSDSVITTIPKGSYGHKTLYAEWAGNATNALYKITFNTGAGDEMPAIQVPANTTVKAKDTSTLGTLTITPAGGTAVDYTPVRKGYSNTLWTTATGGSVSASGFTVNADATLTANWAAKTVNVTFNYNDRYGSETVSGTKALTYGAAYGPLFEVTRPGFTFDGWFTDDGYAAEAPNNPDDEWGEQVLATDAATPTDNGPTITQTLYAKWTSVEYKVTLDANGGTLGKTVESSFTVENGKKWLTDYEGLIPVSASDSEIGRDLTISRPGYTFTGWHLGGASGTVITEEAPLALSDAAVNLSENTTLVATWAPAQITLSYFDTTSANTATTWKNEATSTSAAITYGTTYPTLATPTAVTGYKFDGWYTKQVGGEKITAGTTVTLTKNTDLYAHWVPGTYTVTLNPNLAGLTTTTTSVVNVTYGEPYTLTTPQVPAGYKFLGWTTTAPTSSDNLLDSSASLTYFPNEGTWTGVADTPLYGVWQTVAYKITLHLGGGTQSDSNWTSNEQTYKVTSQTADIKALPASTSVTAPTDLEFVGWFASADLTGTAVAGAPVIAGSTGNKDFYAKYKNTDNNLVTVSFDTDGGSKVDPVQVAKDGKITAPTAPTKAGYAFDKWHVGSATGAEFAADSTTFAKDTVLVATWKEKADDVAVTLQYAGANIGTDAAASVALTKGGEASMHAIGGETYASTYYGLQSSKTVIGLPEAELAGHTFVGWFTKNGLTSGDWGKQVNETDKVEVDSITLNAKFTTDKYTVTYDANGGRVTPESNTATYNTNIALPTPTRSGYNFVNWFTDEALETAVVTEAAGDYKVTEDVTLYAKWNTKKYDITYDYDGGILGKDAEGAVIVNPEKFTAEDAITLQNPEKPGYTFAGWIDVDDLTATPQQTMKIAKGTSENKVFKATWTVRDYRITFLDDDGSTLLVKDYPYNTIAAEVEADLPDVSIRTLDGYDYKFKAWTPAIADVTGNATYTAERYGREAHPYAIDYNAESLLGADNSYVAEVRDSGGNITTARKGNPDEYYFNSTLTLVAPDSTAKPLGYTFTGWYVKGDVVAPTAEGEPYTAKEGAEKVETLYGALGVEYTGDKELYATWELTDYKIDYALNYGTNAEANPATFTVKDNKITLANPTREGYVFDGWYSPTSGTGTATDPFVYTTFDNAHKVTEIDPAKQTNATTTIGLYAKWLIGFAEIADIADQVYGTGSSATPVWSYSEPAIKVYGSDGAVVPEANYSKVYTNNTAVGTATVTVTATAGNATYSGSISKTFNIVAPPTDAASLKELIAKAQAELDDTTQLAGNGTSTADQAVIAGLPAGDYYIVADTSGSTEIQSLKTAIMNATDTSNKQAPAGSEITTRTSELMAALNAFSAKRQLATTSKDALADAIATAQKALDKYEVSADGTDIAKDDEWLTAADKAALEDAIKAAQAVADKADASQADIDAQIDALEDAMDAADKASHMGTKKDVYTFKFYAYGGEFSDGSDTLVVEVTEGDKLPRPTLEVTRDGYTFDNWTSATSGVAVNFNTVVDAAVYSTIGEAIRANWQRDDYLITYHTNGGTWAKGSERTAANTTYDINTPVILPVAADLEAPVETGYTNTFVGWFDNATFQGDAVLSIPRGSMGDREFWAQWKHTKVDAADGTTVTKEDVTLTSDALADDKQPEGEEIRFDVYNQSSDAAKVSAAAAIAEAGDASAKDVLDNADAKFLFDVDLKVVKSTNKADVDEEATAELKGALAESPLTLEFYVGAKYAGRAATVYHVHDGALAEAKEATVTEDGHVSIQVTQLSEFLIAVEPGEGPGPEPGDAVTVWRLYNPNSGEHLFTTDKGEYDDLQTVGWNGEGEAWKAPKASSTPIYRVYNPNNKWGDHHYTADKEEVDFLVNAGWQQDDFEMYSDDAHGLDIYCLYNPNAEPMGYSGTHHYTSDKGEYDDLDAIGWQGEGVKFYGLA